MTERVVEAGTTKLERRTLEHDFMDAETWAKAVTVHVVPPTPEPPVKELMAVPPTPAGAVCVAVVAVVVAFVVVAVVVALVVDVVRVVFDVVVAAAPGVT